MEVLMFVIWRNSGAGMHADDLTKIFLENMKKI
jgi:hypothetical protein